MRRVLACLLILAALAGSATAQTAKPMRVVPKAPRDAPAPAPSDTPALPPPLIPLTGAVQAIRGSTRPLGNTP
jgi:hypothetical protein